jgi:hypothetical protein
MKRCIIIDSIKKKVGWQYIEAPKGNQAYKEGRFIVEKAKVIKELLL